MIRLKTKIMAAIVLMLASISLTLGGIEAFADDQIPSNQTSESTAPENTSADTVGGTENLENDESPIVSGEEIEENTESQDASEYFDENLFEQIYQVLELNADKIFSILAFVGTLLVGFGYKSGLLPLLRESLSKLKGSIDGVKADGEESKIKNEKRFAEISSAICAIGGEIEGIKGNCESYEEVCRQRESLRLILEGQIDMLYAIFMTSALPQYQKDEIGERISRMREELKNYGSSEEN